MTDAIVNDSNLVDPTLDDVDFDTYTDQELLALDSELTTKVALLDIENMIFDSFLSRMMPNIIAEEGLDSTKPTDDGKDGDRNINRRDKKKKGNDKKEVDKPYFLSFEQKNEIAVREMEEFRDSFGKEKEEWAKVVDYLKVSMNTLR